MNTTHYYYFVLGAFLIGVMVGMLSSVSLFRDPSPKLVLDTCWCGCWQTTEGPECLCYGPKGVQTP